MYLSCAGGSECVHLSSHNTLQFWARTASGQTSSMKVIGKSYGADRGTGERALFFHLIYCV